jgi:hypothetical protein
MQQTEHTPTDVYQEYLPLALCPGLDNSLTILPGNREVTLIRVVQSSPSGEDCTSSMGKAGSQHDR